MKPTFNKNMNGALKTQISFYNSMDNIKASFKINK